MLSQRRIKCCFVGDYGVGKSSVIFSFLDKPIHKVQTTIGVDFFTKMIRVGDADVILSLWDTAGAETYRSLMHSYIRDADIIVLVYDRTKSESNILYWMRAIEHHKARVIGVLGNKSDLTTGFYRDLDELLVPWSRQEFNIVTGACSSRNREEVKLFLKKCILKNLEDSKVDACRIALDKHSKRTFSYKCCT